MSLLYAFWNARQNILTWYAGFAGDLFYTGISAHWGLYANAGLSLVFCSLMIYGCIPRVLLDLWATNSVATPSP